MSQPPNLVRYRNVSWMHGEDGDHYGSTSEWYRADKVDKLLEAGRSSPPTGVKQGLDAALCRVIAANQGEEHALVTAENAERKLWALRDRLTALVTKLKVQAKHNKNNHPNDPHRGDPETLEECADLITQEIAK